MFLYSHPKGPLEVPIKFALKSLKEFLVATAAACETSSISIPSIFKLGTKARVLPEDVELQSFGPLAEAHANLDFSSPVEKASLLGLCLHL